MYYNHNHISREAKIIILKRRYSIGSLQNLTHEKVQCCCFRETGSKSLQKQGFILDCFLVIIKTYSPVFVHVHLLQGEVDDILGNTINIYSEVILTDVVLLHLDPVLALLLLALQLEALLQQRRHLLLGDDALAGEVVHGEAVPDLLLATLDWERGDFKCSGRLDQYTESKSIYCSLHYSFPINSFSVPNRKMLIPTTYCSLDMNPSCVI